MSSRRFIIQPRLLILERPENALTNYRGVDRCWPSYVDDVADDHPVNQAFRWFCAEGGESGIIHDLGKARELVRTYLSTKPGTQWDIVQLLNANEPDEPGSTFLGYDISIQSGTSLLSSRLALSSLSAEDALSPIVEVVHRYFRDRLNLNGLLATLADALLFLRCVTTIESLRPGFYTSYSVDRFAPQRLVLRS